MTIKTKTQLNPNGSVNLDICYGNKKNNSNKNGSLVYLFWCYESRWFVFYRTPRRTSVDWIPSWYFLRHRIEESIILKLDLALFLDCALGEPLGVLVRVWPHSSVTVNISIMRYILEMIYIVLAFEWYNIYDYMIYTVSLGRLNPLKSLFGRPILSRAILGPS